MLGASKDYLVLDLRKNWNVVMSRYKEVTPMDLLMVVLGGNDHKIFLLDSLSKNISSFFSPCLVGWFLSFHLVIEMAKKWCGHSKRKGSVIVLPLPGEFFIFQFMH